MIHFNQNKYLIFHKHSILDQKDKWMNVIVIRTFSLLFRWVVGFQTGRLEFQ